MSKKPECKTCGDSGIATQQEDGGVAELFCDCPAGEQKLEAFLKDNPDCRPKCNQPEPTCPCCGHKGNEIHTCNKSKCSVVKELQASTRELYASLDTEHIKQVLKLENEIERHRWIPVSERLPEEDIDCLCFEGKFAGLGSYQRNSNTLRMQWQVNGFVSKRVTHWKPIVLPLSAKPAEKP